MREFVRKAALFALFQLVILALVVSLYRVDRNAYLASFVDKHDRLEATKGPRLLLVGGSNVCFSTDSAELERRVGLEPVNLALQHSLGLPFMLREVEDAMRRDDVVVLSPEYGQYQGRTEEPLAVLGLLEQDRRAWQAVEVDWTSFKALSDRSHLWLRGVLRSSINGRFGVGTRSAPPYTRDSFNRYGDVVAHWTMRAPGFGLRRQSTDDADEDIFRKLDRFAETCREKGVTPLLFHPAIPKSKYDAMGLARLQPLLNQRLPIRQLNRIDEMIYPDELFFDAVYHLTHEGVKRRTALLATRLESALLRFRSSVAEPPVRSKYP